MDEVSRDEPAEGGMTHDPGGTKTPHPAGAYIRMRDCPQKGDGDPNPCVMCGATVAGNDAVGGVCQIMSFIGRPIGDWITRAATDPLIPAAIAVARSEAAASTPAPGEPEGQAHEPWPEMEALRAALDVVLPGWRD